MALHKHASKFAPRPKKIRAGNRLAQADDLRARGRELGFTGARLIAFVENKAKALRLAAKRKKAKKK